MKRIGVYSGTFDPVHTGHLAFAWDAMRTCSLETVLFIPEPLPRNKPHASAFTERTTGLSEALTSTPFQLFATSQQSITTDTLLEELRKAYPGAEFVFLIGSDVAVFSLPHWGNLSLLSPYQFAIGMRMTEMPQEVRNVMDTLDFSYTLIETDHTSLSSTLLRQPLIKVKA